MADEPRWGEDTVALGASGAAPEEAAEPATGGPSVTGALEKEVGWVGRPPMSVLAIGVAVIIVIAASLLGGGGEREPTPLAPRAQPRQIEREDEAAPRRGEARVDGKADRHKRSERLVGQRRRAREHRPRDRTEAKSKKRSAPDPRPVPEYAPEPEPEYTPESVPEATASPEAAPSRPASTPPAVEFGM